MKKILFLAALLITVMQAWAAPVDEASARTTAQRFLLSQVDQGRLSARAVHKVELGLAMPGSKQAATPAFYVFNAHGSFVIVSGDDRARPVLACGDGEVTDLQRLPANMRFWLSFYQRQLQYLQEHPDLDAASISRRSPSRAASVNPLVTAQWSQNAPYWNECPVYGTDTCYTGCAATALAMVFHYWKYPKQQTPAVPAYTTDQYGAELAELPPTVFDWNNMLDRYVAGNFTPDQAAAVAHLMRYIGQAEMMDYTISGSGALIDDIMRAVLLFEYDENAQVYYMTDALGLPNYSDAQWTAMIQNELAQGRPIVYCAYDNYDGGGHAFNVDGYDATDDTYHVNWGWGGRGNGFFALNAFSYGDYTFGTSQQMVVGIQPPADYQTPRLQAYPNQVELQCYIHQSATAVVALKGTNLTGDVTLALNDADGVFAIDAVTVPRDIAEQGTDITVTYSPTAVGSNSATLVCTSPGTDPVTVTLQGNAPLEVYDPVMLPADDARVTLTSFRADWTDPTPDGNVASYTLEVKPKPAYSLLVEADFSNLPQMAPTNQASHASDYLPEGWTFNGSEFNLEGGCVSIRNRGTITTSVLDLKGYDKMTIEITARAYGYYGTGSELEVTTSQGTQELVFMYAYETQTLVVDCAEAEQVIFKAGYYPMIRDIKIYAGDATQGSTTEADGTDYRLIENITSGKSYTVSDLTAGGSFLYRVKAVYVNGAESAWSNVEMVTLHEAAHGSQPGDVNHDGHVNVTDVVVLISYLTSGQGEICDLCADLNGDDKINITDVTRLITILLNNN